MNHKIYLIILAGLIVTALVVGAVWYFVSGQRSELPKSEESVPTKLANKIEFKLKEDETIAIPGTDVKIKAIRISERCTHVPPPDCGDEATIEFSHIKLSSTYAFTLQLSPKFPQPENTKIFFGHKFTITEVQGTQATIVVEIQEEIPGDISGWLLEINREFGFEIQHPRIFEFEDMGEVTPSPQLYYNHWIIIRASGKEFPEHFTILIYNNVNQGLDEFTNAHIFPGDSTPKNSVVGTKKAMESLHVGLDGETKNYFWLDANQKRGAIFGINPAKTDNLSDFHKIIESFQFTQ